MSAIVTTVTILILGAGALLATVIALWQQDKLEKEKEMAEYYRSRFYDAAGQVGQYYAWGYRAGRKDIEKDGKKSNEN